MLSIIAAVCKTNSGTQIGIGKNNEIPWKLKNDLLYFKQKTKRHTVIMGSNTYKSIGKLLPDRNNVILSKSLNIDGAIMVRSFDELDLFIKEEMLKYSNEIFIIGGSDLYNYYINNPLVGKLYITEIYKTFECDRYFPIISNEYNLVESRRKLTENGVDYRFLIYNKNNDVIENPYYKLGEKILKEGISRSDRTGTGTISIFGHQMRFDILKSIPLLTSKRVPWKMCIEELLWFLRGETDANILQKKGINIWNANTSREFLDNMGFFDVKTGELRYGYGHQIRRFGPNKVDQLMYVENLLKTDPFSRRIMWNLWNASDLKDMVLTPCFTKGHKVLTDQGYCCIEDIQQNDLIYTHKGEYKKCLNIQKKIYTGNLITIKIDESQNEIECTPEHLFYVCDKNEKSNRYWIEAEKLSPIRHILLNKNKIESDHLSVNINDETISLISGSLWYTLGFLWENHELISNDRIRFNIKTISEYKELVDNIGNIKIFNSDFSKKNGIYYIANKVLCACLTANSNIPEIFSNLYPSYIENFLDGYRLFNKNIVFDKDKALMIQRLYYKCGYKTIIKKLFKDKEEYIILKISNKIISGDYLEYSLSEIKTEWCDSVEVFNLEVEDHNSYTVSGVAVHNCHNQVQFYVKEIGGVKKLSAQLYCRSSDYFLGLPFNIMSYTVLIYILAIKTGMVPDELIITLGDSHIYNDHIDQVRQLISRPRRSDPVLIVSENLKNLDYNDIDIESFDVIGYFPGKNIKAKMAV